MFSVARFIPFLSLLALFPAVANAAALAARASSTPSCFVCPTADSLGFSLGDNSNTNGVLFCSYPAISGEDPNDFFCTYDSATGVLTQDHDAGLCVTTAITSTSGCNVPSKRDNIVKILKRRAEARAAKPQSSQPKFMGARGALGKKKRSV